MSNESTADGSARIGPRVRRLLGRTRTAVGGTLSRRDGKTIFALATAVYLVVFEYGFRHLLVGDGTVDVFIVADPLARMVQPTGPYQWEPIALVSLGPVQYLFSPLTVAVGIALALLVGINLAVSWVLWRGPTACRVNPGVGAAAGLPALLSGAVCCGPTVLLVVGLQASGGLLAVFQWLIPIAVVLLVATLLWVGRHVEPGGDLAAG